MKGNLTSSKVYKQLHLLDISKCYFVIYRFSELNYLSISKEKEQKVVLD